MTMQRWDPFNDMFSLRQAMDRLLEDAVIWPGRTARSAGQTGFGVPIDLIEHENELVVRASLPGVRPDDVTLQIQGNTHTIEGEIHEEYAQPPGQASQSNGQQAPASQGNGQQAQRGQQEQPRYHHQERRYGRFSRQITLPVPVDSNRTEARFENGVLTVTLPKAAEARQRRIPVTAGSQAQQLAAGRTR